MKILFVCRANVVRSQMAAALYNKFTNTNDASSAGTIVDNPGETLGKRAQSRPVSKLVLEAMDTYGLDISSAIRTQLIPSMLSEYDLVVNMAGPEFTPDWFTKSEKYRYWEVIDPMASGIEAMTETIETIEYKVKELISQSK